MGDREIIDRGDSRSGYHPDSCRPRLTGKDSSLLAEQSEGAGHFNNGAAGKTFQSSMLFFVITRSRVIRRVCHFEDKRHMIKAQPGTPFHYCNIGSDRVAEFKAAPPMGRYSTATSLASEEPV